MRRAVRAILVLVFAGFVTLATGPARAQGDPGERRRDDSNDKRDVKTGNAVRDRVVLAFDPGSHTRPITAMGFTKDGAKLVTVAWDYSIQIWSARTGERLDILRLPAYGRDNGIDAGRWNIAAISADGNYVAIGGEPKQLYDESGKRTRLLLVDVANRIVRDALLGGDDRAAVVGLAFSADGNRLAVATGGEAKSIQIVDDVQRILRDPVGARRASRPKPIAATLTGEARSLSLTPSGDRLVVGELRGSLHAWNIAGGDSKRWKPLAKLALPERTDEVAWAPDGKQFARAWTHGSGGINRGIEIRSADGALVKRWTFLDLAPGFQRQNVVATMRFLDADRIHVTAHGQVDRSVGYGAVGALVNIKTGTATRLFGAAGNGMFLPAGAATADGLLAATATDFGLEAVIHRLADGKVLARCGSRTPMPTIVGWSTDPRSPGFAWSDDPGHSITGTKPENLKYGFDLSLVRPIESFVPDLYSVRRLSHGDWKLNANVRPNTIVDFSIRNTTTGAVVKHAMVQCATLIPNGAGPPRYAFARHDFETQMGSYATIESINGNNATNLLPVATRYRDMTSSPDGRYLIASTGTHRLSIYRTDGSRFPFMNYVQANGEWVLWTPEGYYAASPGGERLIGWAATNGANEFASYQPVERYAKQFRRPDVLKAAFEKGSVRLALESLGTSRDGTIAVVAPVATLSLVEQRDGRVTVKAKAKAGSGTRSQPLTAMHLLLNGRTLPDGQGRWKPVPANTAEETFAFDLPAGVHELKLYARAGDVASLSEPLTLKGPRSATVRTTLHRICVGIDDYDDNTLPRIGTAANDAKAIHDAFAAACVGDANRFGTSSGTLLTDRDATRERILKSLDDARRRAKPGDLTIIFFSGHGRKTDREPFLLTREADVAGKLEGRSLSGTDLKRSLKDFECPVLLLLDARHATGIATPARSAVDDLTRTLCDETVGVTILSAAMAHETPVSGAVNGIFAKGILKGLKAGPDVPYDPHERVLYANHLHMVAFSEARRASKGMQNPFLHAPWTAPPIALRRVP